MSRPVSPHFCSLFTIWCVCFVSSVDSSNRKLIVVSFDAFKPVYFEQKITPFLQQFYTNGIRATRMNNSFPTKTFVNHFSIATGSINIFELFLKIKRKWFHLKVLNYIEFTIRKQARDDTNLQVSSEEKAHTKFHTVSIVNFRTEFSLKHFVVVFRLKQRIAFGCS